MQQGTGRSIDDVVLIVHLIIQEIGMYEPGHIVHQGGIQCVVYSFNWVKKKICFNFMFVIVKFAIITVWNPETTAILFKSFDQNDDLWIQGNFHLFVFIVVVIIIIQVPKPKQSHTIVCAVFQFAFNL